MVWFVLPLATAGVSGAFGVAVLRRFLEGRKRHNLLWAVGLLAIMAAATCQLVAELAGGWPEPVFRLYYFMAGVGPATLGAGTVYLLKNRRAADYFLYAIAGLALAQAVACAVLPLESAYLTGGEVETGVKAAAPAMRYLIAILSTAGTVALVVGALLSWRATRHHHNLMIAAGSVVFATGGTIAGLLPHEGGLSTTALYLGNLVGIVLLFVGFWLARTTRVEPNATLVAAALVARGPL
jgi:hypothetical protein